MALLSGHRALVGGASQGIGRACAVELARLGASVTAMARDEAALREVVSQLDTQADQKHGLLSVDFTDPAGLQAKVAAHVRDAGPITVLVNNTGGPPSGPLTEATADALRSGFSNHVVCFQLLAQTLLPGMKEARFGRIVNIISTSVVQPIKGLGVSNTVRAAVANWGRTLAAEVAPFGVTVNNVLPGYTDTARLRSLLQKWADRDKITYDEALKQSLKTIPAGRLADAAEIAAVVGFLTSPAASYVNGVNLPVDGGRTAIQS